MVCGGGKIGVFMNFYELFLPILEERERESIQITRVGSSSSKVPVVAIWFQEGI